MMPRIDMQKGRKGVPAGLFGLRLGQKRDKLNKPYLVLELFPKRMALAAGVIGAVAYVVLAFVLYQVREAKLGDYNQITYWDVLVAPVRMQHLKELQGKSQIALGLNDYKNENWREAYLNLQNGLRLYPADQEARLRYASLENAYGNREKATRLLIDGLQYGYPDSSEYLPALFSMMHDTQNMPDLERATIKLLALPEIQNDPTRRYGIQKNLLRTQMINQRYLEAYDTATTINNDPESPFQAHDGAVLSLIKLGRGDEALAYLDELDAATQTHPQFLILRADAHRNLEQREQTLEILQSIFRLHPTATQTQEYAILMMLIEGDKRNAVLFQELYLNLNANQPANIINLAVKMTDLPDSDMTKRIYEFTVNNRMTISLTIEFLVAQAYLTEGKWDLARSTYDNWVKKLPPEKTDKQIDLFGLILNAIFMPGTASNEALVATYADGKLSPELYWEGAEAMRKVANYETALRISDLAIDRYPYNELLIGFRQGVQRDLAAAANDRGQALRKQTTTGYRTDDIVPLLEESNNGIEY